MIADEFLLVENFLPLKLVRDYCLLKGGPNALENKQKANYLFRPVLLQPL